MCAAYLPIEVFGAYPNALCQQHYREYDRGKQKGLTQKKPGRKNRYTRAWAEKHPEQVKEHQRRHGQKLVASGKNAQKHRDRFLRDPGKMRTYWRAAYKRKYAANPLYFYYRTMNRRALRKNAPGTCTHAETEALLREFQHQCVYCGATADTLDHIVPLHKGGPNYVWNIVPACRSCNGQKSARDPMDFAKERGLTGAALARVEDAVARAGGHG